MKAPDYRHKASHVLVTGRSSSGKSTLLQTLITEGATRTTFIFDPEGEFSERLKLTASPTLAGLGEDQISLFTPGANTVWADEFDDFCFFCFNFATLFPGRSLMVVDELQDYVDTFTLPDTFRDCLQKGRRYGLDCLYASQQPNLLHNIIRSQTSEVYSFAQSDALSTKFVARLGVNSEAVLALHDLEFIHKQIGRPETKGKIVFDKRGLARIVAEK